MERILIIEDELPMRTALHDVLAGEGYRVLTAPEGETGLQRAVDEKPDLILLDIMMPKLDGYAVCAELRRLSNPVPILMLTAKGQVEDRVQGLDVGADDYLVKPFSTEELLARVRAMLRRVQRQTKAPTTLVLGEATLIWSEANRHARTQDAAPDGQGIRHAAADGGDAGRTGVPRAVPGRRLGLHRFPDHPHRG
jgi:DNA-binding response OmpR family regulator